MILTRVPELACDYESVVNDDPSDEDKSEYIKQALFRNEE